MVPADVIDKFGLGIRPLARELGLDPATVFMWRERGRHDAETEHMRDKLRMWTLVGVEYEGEPVRVVMLERLVSRKTAIKSAVIW